MTFPAFYGLAKWASLAVTHAREIVTPTSKPRLGENTVRIQLHEMIYLRTLPSLAKGICENLQRLGRPREERRGVGAGRQTNRSHRSIGAASPSHETSPKYLARPFRKAERKRSLSYR